MDIKGLSAIQKYAAAKPATEPDEAGGAPFKGLARDFASTMAQSEETSRAAMIGDADPHALVTGNPCGTSSWPACRWIRCCPGKGSHFDFAQWQLRLA